MISFEKIEGSIGKWLYQRFLEIFIYPSLWTAAGIASLSYFTQEALGLPLDWRPVVFIFAAALLPYNLDRVLDSYFQPTPDPKIQSYFRNPSIWLLPLVAAIAVAVFLFDAPLAVRLVSCGGVLPLIYGLPILPLGQGKNRRWYRFKDVPGAKAWIVAIIITYAIVSVPLAYAGRSFDESAFLTTLFLLVFTGTNSHLFDVRDLHTDREKGVLTLPLMVGVEGNRRFWTGLNLSLLVLLSGFWTTGMTTPPPIVVIPSLLVNLAFIWLIDSDTPRNVYNIGLDGCLFLPSFLIGILNFSC